MRDYLLDGIVECEFIGFFLGFREDDGLAMCPGIAKYDIPDALRAVGPRTRHLQVLNLGSSLRALVS